MNEETPGPFEHRNFNPRSTDAMFATIIAGMKSQDAQLEKILKHAEHTNGRVDSLESWRTTIKAKIAVIAGGISAGVAIGAWLIEQYNKS